MDELIKTFHIDWKLIAAQLVNFAIVFFVLWKFALKPLMKTMQEREHTIAKSLKDAEAIDRERTRTAEETKQQITAAQREALAILDMAKKQAEDKRQEMILKAKHEVEGIALAAKQQIQAEKESMLRDAHQELAGLVIAGVQKVLSTSIDVAADKKFIKDRIGKK